MVAVRFRYRADEADRRYGRYSSQTFPDLWSAVEWARSRVAPVDQGSFERVTDGVPVGGGALLPVASSLAAGPDLSAAAFTRVPPSWGQRWRQARHETGQRQVLVHAWGDSITVGVGASDFTNRGWFGLVGDFLRAEYGDGGSGYLPHGNAVVTGSWTASTGFSGAATTAGAAASLTWTSVRGTTVRLFIKNTGTLGTGTLRYSIDGEPFTNVTPPVGFTVEPGVIERLNLSDVPHTVVVEWVSGNVTVHGVQGTYLKGVVTARCAQSGKAASDYAVNEFARATVGITNGSPTVTSAAPGVFTSSLVGRFIAATDVPSGTSLTAVASATSATMSQNATATGSRTAVLSYNSSEGAGVPGNTLEPFLATGLGRADLVLVALGVNDGADLPRTANSVRNGLSHVFKPYMSGSTHAYTPDLVLLVGHQGDWFDLDGEWPEYTSEIASLASSLGAALVDVWGLGRRSHQHWQDLGLFADTIHPNDAGHVVMARAVLDVLLS